MGLTFNCISHRTVTVTMYSSGQTIRDEFWTKPITPCLGDRVRDHCMVLRLKNQMGESHTVVRIPSRFKRSGYESTNKAILLFFVIRLALVWFGF